MRVLLVLVLFLVVDQFHGFVPTAFQRAKRRHVTLYNDADDWASAAMNNAVEFDSLKSLSLDDMKAGQMKKELTYRGLSAEGLFEKADLRVALEEARVNNVEKFNDASEPPSAPAPSPSAPAPSPSPSSSSSSDVSSMKIKDIKLELESYSVAYNDLFEKSEFIERLSKCRDEGMKPVAKEEEEEEGDYKDVSVSKMGGGGGMGGMGGMGGLGDIASMFGGIGGGGGGGGGMGGMNMADLASMMGGMGGGGGGGMGGPGMQSKIQELMKNPKAMAIIQKAQSNPKVMAAVTDCMSNPGNIAKYSNDPDIKPLLDELKGFI
ncbi:hypothetical protein TrLO_g5111 [Triparma laevis f. longispina]|uniref:STI1 domain-containing protein n=1 Tax=Triparma laevis f. longispina TaxID=1714387 RepID=A0A9W6ZRJ2_9STRA|nr:hypothetical protein TrLO_g5111 [Triparma laevis f. longispina]